MQRTSVRAVQIQNFAGAQSRRSVLLTRTWCVAQTHLSLGPRPFTSAPARATAKSLFSFAEHCPHLIHLAYTFDARQGIPSSLQELHPQLPRNNHLCRLITVTSPLDSSPAIAALLSHLFPVLTEVYTQSVRDTETYVEAWSEVQAILKQQHVANTATVNDEVGEKLT